ncbi:CBR-JAMP-1 protein [Ditylenchus destructor]|uniref:Seipin n=1 Tax=Ditylenchus destructor TaxID=166010 RepID=A0AAD4MJA5_9BILA|nr:CBR-JAMP-1 protein [Ditylenchus destructor]
MAEQRECTKLWRVLSHFSLEKLIILIIQFVLVVYLSFFTPMFVRYAFATKFVHHEEPLEFTFQTCDVHLAGVCSYPEAVMPISEEFELQPSYYHSFTLNLNLFDTEQNRRLGIFLPLQNKFIQLSSASLKIRAQVGLISYIVSEFPIISYALIFGISFTTYFTIFFLHWAYKGIHIFAIAWTK